MNYTQAIDYINSTARFGDKPGLERVRALLEAMGGPHERLKFVHVAGTNGKGSVCAMVESILRAAGYQTGLYISPYVEDYRERMQVNRELIPKDRLAELFTQTAALCEALPDRPRKFEIETAAALRYFAEERCDIVVLEVGLGGRLDATNVIGAPEAAVITSISYDHMRILGDTLEQIAFEKRGIIKPGCAVVEASALPPADRVLSSDLYGSVFVYKGNEYAVSLMGAHQIENATVAVETAFALRGRGWAVPDAAILDGLRGARWNGRLEIVRDTPLCIIDGAHNADAVVKLCGVIDDLLRGRRLVTVMAMGPDKPFDVCAPMLAQRSEHFIRTDFANAAAEARRAVSLAGDDGVVLACGSLHMIGDAKRAMQSAPGAARA
ncbi:MAG: Mur ligase family protein [Oscillospiraceae bacterium]|nr:Mur ligase family protein [Oscillospiraceae bacterium]